MGRELGINIDPHLHELWDSGDDESESENATTCTENGRHEASSDSPASVQEARFYTNDERGQARLLDDMMIDYSWGVVYPDDNSP